MPRWFHGCWALLLLTVSCHRQPAIPAAEVHGHPITSEELSAALRAHLWSHNLKWSDLDAPARKHTRVQVMEDLVNSHLLRACRLKDTTTPASSTPAEKREMEMLQRQFADPADFPRRLAAQQQTTKSLAASIHDAQLDEAWLAEKIQPSLKTVTQQQEHAWYDEFKETLRIPPAYHAAHLFLTRHDNSKPDRESEIRALHRQFLTKEKTFAQLTASYSDDARTKNLGGDLGWFTRERMPADFIAAVERLSIGQCSEPVQTRLGWHLILLMERRPSRLPTFEEAHTEITAHLTTARRQQAVQNLLAQMRQPQSVFYHAEVIDRTEPAP